jgi:hypothetical protein
MNHTLETLMALADSAIKAAKKLAWSMNNGSNTYVDSCEAGLVNAQEAFRAALTEALPQEAEKVTGWNDGLSQDYDAKLGRWFADRPGAKQQLRETLASPQPVTAMSFIPWSKEAEMMESWTNKPIGCVGHDCADCRAKEEAESLLQEVAACIGVGGYNGATPKQLAERICEEFERLDGKARAAQPARVPGAISRDDTEHGVYYYRASEVDGLMSAQQARKSLTDEQITTIAHRKASKYTHRSDPESHAYGFVKYTLIDFVRAIELEHGIGGER